MTQFKEKSGKTREGASVGLYTYPVLQAADMLLYRATHVPVGEDQKQHLELARDIAIKFNTDYDIELFVPPEPYIGGRSRGPGHEPPRRDGENVQVRPIGHEPHQSHRQRRPDRAEDPQGEDRPGAAAGRSGRLLEGRPEAKNLVGIYGAVTGESVEQVLVRFAGQGFGAFKPALADALVALLHPLRARLEELRNDPAELDRLLAAGSSRAASLGTPVLQGRI